MESVVRVNDGVLFIANLHVDVYITWLVLEVVTDFLEEELI